MTRRVLRVFRSLATKGEGVAAVVRTKEVRWARKPESITNCSLWSGFENLMRKMREERSYTLDIRREVRRALSSWAMTWWG